MPYLGNQHIVGDSVNNFKVLDDISSHTATFDGSASSVVSTANETIKILNHRFVHGQRVTYNNGASTTTINVTVGVDSVSGQATGVFYLNGVEKPASFPLKRGFTYIFNQSNATNETYGGANHPLMFSTGPGGDHNGHGHYMTGVQYKLDGVAVTMAGYVSGFNAATTRTVEWTIPNNAPSTLYYWCHYHTGQGNSFSIGDGDIAGLVNGTAYYVIYDTAHTIKLATSATNAASLTAINLTGVGSGTSHTLNVAFDGVNKKFRVTHGNGIRARIHTATQISVAINNVIQKPNNDANNFSEGYAVEVRDIVVFKIAPTVNDIFFGSLTGETRGTFEISDHKIDNYTGDGSTSQFSLSQNAPNVESLLVTLNGVTQHPSDGTTTRSFSLPAENLIEFTSAPASGVEIQIRHMGFAAASTADVSGFYGRTGNVGLIASDNITTGDITSRNVNSSGIITATKFVGPIEGAITSTDATFTGDVSIGGTLTYEDVTNVDSVGLGTFRDGLVVKTGTATTALIVEGNARVTGILTIGTGSLTITDRDINAVGVVTGSNFKTGSTNVHTVGIEVAQINVLGGPTKIGAGLTITHEGNYLSSGISTALQFKTGSTNVHNVGIEVAQLNVLGGATKIGSGLTITHEGNFLSSGISTAFQFKTGTSNLHNVGLEIAGINVLGADTPIGLGATVYNSGAAVFTGVVTATTFVGDGSALTGLTAVGTGAIGGLTVKNESGVVVGTAGSVSTLDFNGSSGVTVTAASGAAGIATVAISAELISDSSPQLGGNLDLNGNSITGSGGIPAANLTGTIDINRLGTSGTKSGGTFLAGDNTFKTVTVAINAITNDSNERILTSDGDGTATAESNLTFDGTTLSIGSDATDVLNFSANSTNDARGISFNGRTALSADHNDGYLRLNDSSEFSNGVYTPLNFRADGELRFGSDYFILGQANSSYNMKVTTAYTGGSGGISHFDGAGNHLYQLYGETGGHYGFLDANWAGWDIRKAKNGAFEVDEGSGLKRVLNEANWSSYVSAGSVMYIDVYGQGNAQNRNTANSWAQSAVTIPNNTIYLVRYNNQYSYWVNNNTATANEDRRALFIKNSSGSTYWAGTDFT